MGENQVIAKIKSSLKSLGPKISIYLYGSRARGDANANSDWDLLIILNNNDLNNIIEDKIFTTLYRIELETGQIISPYFLNKRDFESRLGTTPYYYNVSSEGVLL
jgi:predicted nucleotidyltransferase